MRSIRVLHWKAVEAVPLLSSLREAGFTVEYDELWNSSLLREWRANPPSTFVIDLSRLPSHGKEIAIALRQSPKTRHIPIVFCEGASEKVEALRQLFPDAQFCKLPHIVPAVQTAKPVENAARPAAMMNRYGSRTVAQKLGIEEGSTIVLIDPPRDAMTALGGLPANVQFAENAGDVTLNFVHSVDQARSSISGVRNLAAKTKLWILWRKKGAAGHSGVTETLIRETGISLGLVDYKICAVNESWSAMLFARQRK